MKAKMCMNWERIDFRTFAGKCCVTKNIIGCNKNCECMHFTVRGKCVTLNKKGVVYEDIF